MVSRGGRIAGAGWGHAEYQFRVRPETCAGQEAVVQTLAGHAFQIRIGQVIGFDGAQVFLRHVGAGHAFVVGGERDGNAIFHVNRQRMVVAAYAENHIVRSQRDFDEDIALGHFVKKADGIFFVHDGDAVADALGVSALDGGANVKRQIFRRDQAHGEFAGVQRDVHFGIDAVQIVDHGHVLVEVVERDVPILGHHKIQADKSRISRGELEAEQNLREDNFVR